MLKCHVVDIPKSEKRKIHKTEIPLGGGVAIFITCTILITYLYVFSYIGTDIKLSHVVGIIGGGAVLMVGGILDDMFRWTAKKQIWAPVIASCCIIASGIGIETISNPFGSIPLQLNGATFHINGVGSIMLIADALVFVWLMTMMFTTKLLDGLDGLVTGVVAIGAIILFVLSLQTQWFHPEVSMLSLVFAAACLGFLVWNWHPAKIFLGEGGSLFTGFMIAVLAIISGGKIATAVLVMGVPLIDMARVILWRVKKKKRVFEGDSEHLHFKLIHSGLNQKQAVLLFYTISFSFGATAIFLQSHAQLVALVCMGIIMLLVGIWFSSKEKNV